MSNTRDKGFRVRLSESMALRISQYAERYGMPESTLLSFAIAEWVNSQDNRTKTANMAIMDVSKRMSEKFDPALIEKVMAAVATTQSKQPE